MCVGGWRKKKLAQHTPRGGSSQEEGDSSARLFEEAEAGADNQGNMKVRLLEKEGHKMEKPKYFSFCTSVLRLTQFIY